MKTRPWGPRTATPRVAVSAAIALAAAGAVVATARAIDRPSTINITSRETTYRRFDEGPRGRGAGDVEISSLALYNRRITSQAIGHADAVCTFLTTRVRNCTATYTLPRGKIVVGGALTSRLLYELPVLGGTGLYANVRGSLVVTVRSTGPRREILVFRLLP